MQRAAKLHNRLAFSTKPMKMPNFAGSWKMRSSENFDDLLKALGKPFAVIPSIPPSQPMHRFVHISSVTFHQSWGPECGSVACVLCQWLDCFGFLLCFLRLAVVPRLGVSRFIGKALVCSQFKCSLYYTACE